jgi:hypothetical protein
MQKPETEQLLAATWRICQEPALSIFHQLNAKVPFLLKVFRVPVKFRYSPNAINFGILVSIKATHLTSATGSGSTNQKSPQVET